MTLLEQAIASAYQSQGKPQDASNVHALVLKTKFILPIKKDSSGENPQALYHTENSQYFVPVFNTMEHYLAWAGESVAEFAYLEISGIDLINGLADHTYLCLNLGTTYYKEFAPDEILRLKTIIGKLAKVKSQS